MVRKGHWENYGRIYSLRNRNSVIKMMRCVVISIKDLFPHPILRPHKSFRTIPAFYTPPFPQDSATIFWRQPRWREYPPRPPRSLCGRGQGPDGLYAQPLRHWGSSFQGREATRYKKKKPQPLLNFTSRAFRSVTFKIRQYLDKVGGLDRLLFVKSSNKRNDRRSDRRTYGRAEWLTK